MTRTRWIFDFSIVLNMCISCFCPHELVCLVCDHILFVRRHNEDARFTLQMGEYPFTDPVPDRLLVLSYAGSKVLPFYLDKTEVSLQSIPEIVVFPDHRHLTLTSWYKCSNIHLARNGNTLPCFLLMPYWKCQEFSPCYPSPRFFHHLFVPRKTCKK